MHEPVSRMLPNDRLGFYIAAGDQDILSQVNRLMSRSGFVGVMDTAGRLQYLIDGRKGTPFAARRILETAGHIMRDRQDAEQSWRYYLERAADQTLAGHGIRTELKGCRFIRYMLLYAGLDETKLRPVSKMLYPAAAAFFRVSLSQIERDIRYALLKTGFREQGLTSTAVICRLYDEMIRRAGDLKGSGALACPPPGDACPGETRPDDSASGGQESAPQSSRAMTESTPK